MGNALDEFRAQREAVEEVQRRLADVTNLVRALREQATALAQDEGLRELLRNEETWLRRAEDVIRAGAYARDCELQRFWPAVWRRWAVAILLAVVIAFAAGAGYVWADKPYRAELANLRDAAEFGNTIARQVFRMSPAERKQFDALVTTNEAKRH
jgi:hypothetical protein